MVTEKKIFEISNKEKNIMYNIEDSPPPSNISTKFGSISSSEFKEKRFKCQKLIDADNHDEGHTLVIIQCMDFWSRRA